MAVSQRKSYREKYGRITEKNVTEKNMAVLQRKKLQTKYGRRTTFGRKK